MILPDQSRPNEVHPPLSVVYVTLDSGAVIRQALVSLKHAYPSAEVVVVDNGSTDDTLDIAEGLDARIISGHGNIGFGAGVNAGVRACTHELVLVLNPDAIVTEIDPGLLATLPAYGSGVGLVAAKEDGGRHHRPGLPRRWAPEVELLWALIAWFLIPRELSIPRPRHEAVKSTSWVSGSAFLVSRRQFLSLDGFDERLFLYYEDMDLSRRYVLGGSQVSETDAVRVKHLQGTSSPRNHELVVAWQCMSLIEYAAHWNGVRCGIRVTRLLIASLGLIEWCGHFMSRAALFGLRGAKKAESAARVRRHLHDEGSVASLPSSVYPDAKNLLLVVCKRFSW